MENIVMFMIFLLLSCIKQGKVYSIFLIFWQLSTLLQYSKLFHKDLDLRSSFPSNLIILEIIHQLTREHVVPSYVIAPISLFGTRSCFRWWYDHYELLYVAHPPSVKIISFHYLPFRARLHFVERVLFLFFRATSFFCLTY